MNYSFSLLKHKLTFKNTAQTFPFLVSPGDKSEETPSLDLAVLGVHMSKGKIPEKTGKFPHINRVLISRSFSTLLSHGIYWGVEWRGLDFLLGKPGSSSFGK